MCMVKGQYHYPTGIFARYNGICLFSGVISYDRLLSLTAYERTSNGLCILCDVEYVSM